MTDDPPDQAAPQPGGDRQEIDEAAQDWVLLLTSGRATAADRARFEAWLAADPRHADAYRELCALWDGIAPLAPAFAASPRSDAAGETGHAEAGAGAGARRSSTDATDSARRRIGRRWVLTGAVAAGAAACAAVALDLPTQLTADHVTAAGETARVPLPDGSTAWLNTDSALRVEFDGRRRRIRLLQGEALFEVAHDPARRFAVLAHDGLSIALGTRFAVRRQGDGATVTVGAGTVRVVSPRSDPTSGPPPDGNEAVLRPGQQVRYAAGAAPEAIRTVDPETVLAWRRGTIALDATPFPAALAEIERYLPGRIVLLADDRGLEPVTARLSIPEAASGLEALAATHDLTVTWVSPYLAVVR